MDQKQLNEKAEKETQKEIEKIPIGDRIRPDRKEEVKEEVKEEEKEVEEESSEKEVKHDFNFDDSDDTDEDESHDDEEDDNDSDDEEADDEDIVKISKKELQILQKKAAKSNKKDAQIEELRELLGKKEEDVSDDDFQDLTEELAKELGITDKDNASKLLKVMAKLNKRQLKGLQDKLDKIESSEASKSVEQIYESEWKSFAPTLKKEFQNLSDADSEKVSRLMFELSHTPGIGGVEYTDSKDGKRKLNPYDLDYIFFKNRDKFEEVLGSTKKMKGMESGRSQERKFQDSKSGESKPLAKGASVSEIAARDKKFREDEASRSTLRDGGNNRI